MELNNKQLHVENTIGLVDNKLSKEYAPVDTRLFLKPFLDRGWYVERVRSNKKGTRTWHTLENQSFKIGNDMIRIEIINSYNGKEALKIAAGIGRLICSNGMVIGSDFEQFRYVHRGNAIYEKLENTYEQLVAHLNKLKDRVIKLQNTEIPEQLSREIISNIYKRVFETNGKDFKTTIAEIPEYSYTSALEIRRIGDVGKDAYTIMNVIQENLVRYGAFNCTVSKYDKKNKSEVRIEKTKRGSEGNIASHRLNSIITGQFLEAIA